MKSSSKSNKKSKKTVAGFFLFLLLLQGAYAQDFSSLDKDLLTLESIINDTITSMEEQLKSLDSLNKTLQESGNIITEQEKLLAALQTQLAEMSETFRMQSALLEKSEQRLKRWKTFTLIAVPAAAVTSGLVVWAVVK